MKWRGRRGSGNIEDRRGAGGARPPIRLPRGFGGRRGGGFGGRPGGGLGGGPGGGRGMRLPRSRAGLMLLLGVLLVGWLLGGDGGGGLDPSASFAPGPGGAPAELGEADRDMAAFVSVVLADTEEVWTAVFREELNADYAPPVLVLFSGATRSACGAASAATGPFYCPADRKVYLDTAFFDTLRDQLGAGGDFAQAYVIAHEVGHHVQGEIGLLEETQRLRASLPQADANEVSVRTELMADCFAGLWARRAEAMFGSLEPGDVDEAMNAAARIGDDALQRGAGGPVRPDSFTHGTSEQRRRWFDAGWESASMAACDTFAADRL